MSIKNRNSILLLNFDIEVFNISMKLVRRTWWRHFFDFDFPFAISGELIKYWFLKYIYIASRHVRINDLMQLFVCITRDMAIFMTKTCHKMRKKYTVGNTLCTKSDHDSRPFNPRFFIIGIRIRLNSTPMSLDQSRRFHVSFINIPSSVSILWVIPIKLHFITMDRVCKNGNFNNHNNTIHTSKNWNLIDLIYCCKQISSICKF